MSNRLRSILDSLVFALCTTLSFWLGGLPVCIVQAARYAYSAATVGSYEHGLFGLFGGTIVRSVIWAGPAIVFFPVACIAVTFFRWMAATRSWQLYLFSGLLGLFSSGLLWLVWLR